MNQPDTNEQGDLFESHIIPPSLAIVAMRDSGYKNTAYALAELIDNAVQAGASMVEVLCIEKRELIGSRERSRLWEIAVVDNGSGMDVQTLRMALQFGNGTRLNDRTGIGRFGMGLPNASISQAKRVDVWTWQNGSGNAIRTHIDLDKIETGEMVEVPVPTHSPVPDTWRQLSNHIEKSGTLVLWSCLDFERLTWKRGKRALLRTEEIVGRVYRHFISEGTVTIRLFAAELDDDNCGVLNEADSSFFQEDGYRKLKDVVDREADVNDPLYLRPVTALPPPFDKRPMFQPAFENVTDIEYDERVHQVRVMYSIATDTTVEVAGTTDRGKTKYGKHAANNIGISVLRSRREIMLDHGWCIGYDPRERWWGAEVEFPPTLDEVFGVTNNKQAATHFAELATTDWSELADEGEDFIDVVRRLKEDGDPRGWLLELSENIKRDLIRLRDVIKGQGAQRRSSRRTRHNEADDVTNQVNVRWKARSKNRPLDEDRKPRTESDLKEIEVDLTENKEYSNTDAEEIVSLIRDADLKVVYLESDFTNQYELFNVEMKGNVTEIVFNRQHPAFDDIFDTVTTDDETLAELSKEEVIQRFTRAVNAEKIIFGAWARFEREAGVDRAKVLRKVRFDWGQIAAGFLDSYDDVSF